jgi:hypothetical protein
MTKTKKEKPYVPYPGQIRYLVKCVFPGCTKTEAFLSTKRPNNKIVRERPLCRRCGKRKFELAIAAREEILEDGRSSYFWSEDEKEYFLSGKMNAEEKEAFLLSKK